MHKESRSLSFQEKLNQALTENTLPTGPVVESYNSRKGPKYETLKKNKIKLTDEERNEVIKSKATWGDDDKPSPAVWKSKVNGKIWYVTNTHRAYNVTSTLKGTIKRYHDFIKGTA